MLVGLHAQKREPVWLQILQVGVVAWQFLAHRRERLCGYRSGRQRARHDTPSSTKESLCGYQSSRQGLWHSIELILGRVLRNDDCGCLSVFSMLPWLYCICLVTYSMMALSQQKMTPISSTSSKHFLVSYELYKKNSIKKLSAVMLKDFYFSFCTLLLKELYKSSILVQVKLETSLHVI